MQRRSMRYGRVVLGGVVVLGVGLGSAWAQIAVTDPATTARNGVVAVLKNQILETVRAQQERLRSMARRLSADTNLDKYSAPNPPRWRTETSALVYGNDYQAALTYGDLSGSAYTSVARTRQPVADVLAGLSPASREVVKRALATLDAADSTIVAATHQAGLLRGNGRHEQLAIDTLEKHVLDPSEEQSATAVLDKISGAALIGAGQKQARLQYLTAIVEQMLVDNKRARDTEAAVLNMQLGRLRGTDWGESGGGLLAGAADDLRTWRQP